MAIYYFDTFDGSRLVPDAEGSDLPSFQDAHREAVEAVRELVAAAILRSESIYGGELRVRADDGPIVCCVPFMQVLSGAVP